MEFNVAQARPPLLSLVVRPLDSEVMNAIGGCHYDPGKSLPAVSRLWFIIYPGREGRRRLQLCHPIRFNGDILNSYKNPECHLYFHLYFTQNVIFTHLYLGAGLHSYGFGGGRDAWIYWAGLRDLDGVVVAALRYLYYPRGPKAVRLLAGAAVAASRSRGTAPSSQERDHFRGRPDSAESSEDTPPPYQQAVGE